MSDEANLNPAIPGAVLKSEGNLLLRDPVRRTDRFRRGLIRRMDHGLHRDDGAGTWFGILTGSEFAK